MRRYLIALALVVVGVVIGVFWVSQWRSDAVDPRPDSTEMLPRETVVLGRPDYEPRELPEVGNINRIFRNVAAEVKPTVVYITVVSNEGISIPQDGNHENIWPFGNPQRQFQQSSAGSGVILSHDGYIVTNNHVVAGAESIFVMLEDRREFEAEVIGTDPSTDLAVIRVPPDETLPVVALGNSDNLEVGDWVLAVGSPFRLTSTVTAGIVSAMGRQINIIEDQFGIEDFIQTDAAINPGNSGGALVNLNGELVGISTAIATDSGSYEGYGFAVPANLAVRVVQDLIAYGEVRRGYLGVQIRTVSASQARELGLEDVRGVLLWDVYAGSAADRAGLKKGDVLLEIGGREVNASNELQRLIALQSPGDALEVRIWRSGREESLEVQLQPRDETAFNQPARQLREPPSFSPEDRAPDPDLEDLLEEQRTLDSLAVEFQGWGIGPRELSDHDRVAYRVDSGVYLQSIKPGEPAALAGLPAGSIVTHIEDVPVGSIEELVRILDAASQRSSSVLFRVKRADGRIHFYDVPVP